MQESILLTDKEYREYNELSRQIIGAAIEVHQIKDSVSLYLCVDNNKHNH